LVKSEDLNHHGTLFAGRSAEWFVESGFVAASAYLPPNNVVCLKVHGMSFLRPVRLGQTVCFSSKVIYAGNTSLRVYIKVTVAGKEENTYVEGFTTFIHVDEKTIPASHGLKIIPETEEEKRLAEIAKNL